MKFFTNNLLTKICSLRNFSSDTKLISVSSDNKTGFAVLTLQRPPVNSLNLEFLEALSDTLTECKKTYRGLILTSKYDKVFSAGLDFQELLNPKPERLRQFSSKVQDVWLQLYGYDFPLVAVINGHAPAAGCMLTLCADYRIMRSNCKIGLNESLVGMTVPPFLLDTMKHTIGFRQNELAATTGRLFSTKEAFDIGLVDEIVESTEQGMDRAFNFLNNIKNVSREAACLTKYNVRKGTIEAMLKSRDEEIKTRIEWILTDRFQNNLKTYLDSIKKKQ